MLSDRDRETLDDIEREMLVHDPKLSGHFASAWKRQHALRDRQHHPAAYGRASWVLSIIIGVMLLVGAFAVLFGAVGQAAGYVTLAASLAVFRHWLHVQPPRH